MLISIIGLGWFGAPLAEALKKEGHEVQGTTRSPEKQNAFQQHGIRTFLLGENDRPDPALFAADIIILNLPPNERQLEWLKSWPWKEETWIIFISSTSVLNKSHDVLIDEENWIQNHFGQWTILRFGGLLGGERHPGKYFSGKKNLKDGDKMVNLLTRDYAIEFTQKVLREKIQKEIIRVVNIENQTRKDFYTEYCRQAGLPLPEFE